MSHEETRERVLRSLFASTGGNSHKPVPLKHHITEVEFLRLAVRWFLAIETDRQENGPLGIAERPVNAVLPPEAA